MHEFAEILERAARQINGFIAAWRRGCEREVEEMRQRMDDLPPSAVVDIMRSYPRGDGHEPATPHADWWLR